MGHEEGKRVGEVKVKTYILKSDNTLLKLDTATVSTCSLSEDEAESRSCPESGKPGGRACEELVLVYRPIGCVKETNEVDLDAVTTVSKVIVEV